jgi:hypothetical protein
MDIPDTNGDGTNVDAGGGDLDPKDRAGLLAALQAERARAKAASERLTALESAQAEAARKAAEEQGNYRKLYEEAAPKLTRLQELEQREAARLEALAARNSERLGLLPEELRELAPPNADAETLASWIERAEKRVPREPTGTVARGGAPGSLPPEAKAWFDANNIDESIRTLEFWERVKPRK